MAQVPEVTNISTELKSSRVVAKNVASAATVIAAARIPLRLPVSDAAPYKATSELNVPACTIS